MTTPGTYREADGTPVPFPAAIAKWAVIASEELRATASRYHAVITYGELAETVQHRSGVRTRMLLANWIGGLLETVAQRCADEHDVPLTALCVHQDGTIGDGYAKAPKYRAGGMQPANDIEIMAAEDRLACYRAYATDLPADGGRPALTRQVEERRRKIASKDEVDKPKICPNCWTVLPVTGVCDCSR